MTRFIFALRIETSFASSQSDATRRDAHSFTPHVDDVTRYEYKHHIVVMPPDERTTTRSHDVEKKHVDDAAARDKVC